MKTIKKCNICGSEEIVADAWAIWNSDKDEWELYDTYPNYYCNSCEHECSIIEKEVEDVSM